jgi:hypothetical protein
VGHGRHGLDEGVQEGTPAHISQLPALVQFAEHGHRVGGFTSIGQPEHGPPDRPMGWPVEVGLLEHAGDLSQQVSSG